MCGIAGWVRWEPGEWGWSASVVNQMVKTLLPRGPDGNGVTELSRAAFGHTRLAVIDVEQGHQPMTVDGATITFSGEIYNYRRLRRQLERLGHRFTTVSDTEVLARSYLEWGRSCLDRLDGMFAFGIWDEPQQTLLLARDRLGVKPLYFAPVAGGLVFGSEPKALFCHPDVRPRLDTEGLAMIMASFGTHQPGHCPFAGVSELAPGTCLLTVGGQQVIERYWGLPARRHEDDYVDTVTRSAQLLEGAVSKQLEAEVPLCSLLSGGLDSSLVALFANRRIPALRTYAVGFAGEDDHFVADAMRPSLDRPYAALVAADLDLDHTTITLDPTRLQPAQEAATRARDLPSMGNLDASLHLLFTAVAERSTVALSGEAADEVFGGYHWFHQDGILATERFPWTPPGGGLGDLLRPAIRGRIEPEAYLADLYRGAVAETPVLDGEPAGERGRRELSYLALTRFLPVLLDRKDRLSMACGLEVRVPFCDHELVEYVFNIPWALKARGRTPKAVLREIGYGALPSEICERAKSAYPVATDPAYARQLRHQVATTAKQPDSFLAEIVDQHRLDRLLDGTSAKPPWMQNLALAYLDQVDRWATGANLELVLD